MLDQLANCILKIEHGVRTTTRPEDRVAGEKMLAKLAPILAATELNSVVYDDLIAFDRLHSNLFLVDPAPFGTYYTNWKGYRSQCEQKTIAGMTVNERLFVLKLDDQLDRAIEAEDWDTAREILERCFLSSDDISAIIAKRKSGG